MLIELPRLTNSLRSPFDADQAYLNRKSFLQNLNRRISAASVGESELARKIIYHWDEASFETRQLYKQFVAAVVELMGSEVVSEEFQEVALKAYRLFSGTSQSEEDEKDKRFLSERFQLQKLVGHTIPDAKILKVASLVETLSSLQNTEHGSGYLTELMSEGSEDVEFGVDLTFHSPARFVMDMSLENGEVFLEEASTSSRYHEGWPIDVTANSQPFGGPAENYDLEWLRDACDRIVKASTSQLPRDELEMTICRILDSEKPGDEIAGDLLDFVGDSSFEIVQDLIMHRKDLVESIRHGLLVLKSDRSSSNTQIKYPSYATQVTVQTESERQFDKLRRKEEKKNRRAMDHGTENELSSFSFSSLLQASEKKTILDDLVGQGDGPQFSATALPHGTVRKHYKGYEEVIIPPTPTAPMKPGEKLDFECWNTIFVASSPLQYIYSMDGMENILEQLLVASDSSTLKESLECLIETAKTSDGRLDLAHKHIIIPILRLCQSPLQLSAEDLFLSIKLLRNLCAGEIINQDLFIQQNGVVVISTLISSMGLVSGSDNRILHIVLQLLGNISLAGEKHRDVVWRQIFPLGFLDIARVQSKETCDTLCMVIHTCVEGSNERSEELLGDAGLDIIVEIIRTVTIVGFREHWMKLLLFKICFEDSSFSLVFSKLSPVAEAELTDKNVSRINNFGAEQALLLSILSEILKEQLGDIVVSVDFSLFLFGILRNAVGIVDFSTRGKSPLPTGSADVDVMGYSLSILRDICACHDPSVKNQDEDGNAVDMLVSAGLIKFLLTLLRELEPPAIIRKATVLNKKDDSNSQASKYQCPYRGFRRDVVAIIGNCSYHKKHAQDEIREQDGVLLMLQQCVTDEDNPFLREWGIWSIRNVFEGNEENQKLVAQLELQRSVDTPEIAELGLRVEVNPKTQRPKLVNA